jgi:hypothetical protein
MQRERLKHGLIKFKKTEVRELNHDLPPIYDSKSWHCRASEEREAEAEAEADDWWISENQSEEGLSDEWGDNW